MSEDLTMTLYIALRTAPKHWRKGLASRTPTEGDAAAKALAEHLIISDGPPPPQSGSLQTPSILSMSWSG